MTDERKKLLAAAGKIAWACVFLHLNFNFNFGSVHTLNLLPDWIGYLMMVSALPALAAERRQIILLRPLGIGLAVYGGLGFLGDIFGLGAMAEYVSGLIRLLTILFSVVSIYFHFQLLTDLAAIGDDHNLECAGGLRRLRNVRTVMMSALALPLPWEKAGEMQWIAAAYLIVGGVVMLMIMGGVFRFRRQLAAALESGENPAPNPNEE